MGSGGGGGWRLGREGEREKGKERGRERGGGEGKRRGREEDSLSLHKNIIYLKLPLSLPRSFITRQLSYRVVSYSGSETSPGLHSWPC